MKKSTLPKLFLALTTSMSLTLPALAEVAPAAPCHYTFTVDARPADGNFQKISLIKDEEGTYSAKHRVITAGFGFPVSDTTEVLAQGLICEESKEKGKLETLFCSVDMRPADGALTEITLVRNESGLYDATLRTATYGTLFGPGIDETTELAFGLKLKK